MCFWLSEEELCYVGKDTIWGILTKGAVKGVDLVGRHHVPAIQYEQYNRKEKVFLLGNVLNVNRFGGRQFPHA